MPVFIVAMLFAPMIAILPMEIEENKKEKQINELCVSKFKTTKDIKECKAILMKVGQ